MRQGDGTENERVELLRQHERHVTAQLSDLICCLDLIRPKIAAYEDLIPRGLPASTCRAPQLPQRAD